MAYRTPAEHLRLQYWTPFIKSNTLYLLNSYFPQSLALWSKTESLLSSSLSSSWDKQVAATIKQGRKTKGDFKFYWSEGVRINSNCEITQKVQRRDLWAGKMKGKQDFQNQKWVMVGRYFKKRSQVRHFNKRVHCGMRATFLRNIRGRWARMLIQS